MTGDPARPDLPADDRERRAPPPSVRLPLPFDAPRLLAEAAAFPPAGWSAHFNTGYHNGGWTGIALRGTDADPARLFVRPGVETTDTTALASCPSIAAALAEFHCPIRAARLLRLAPGGVIDEHSDPDLVFSDGAARVHIVLATSPTVEFHVDGERVVMEAGECWFLDLSRPHRVANRGTTDRVHLVVDLVVNDWLRGAIDSGDRPARVAAVESGAEAFARFRERVFADEALAARLRERADAAAFIAATVDAGRAAGCAFDPTEVRAAMAAGHRDWIVQWLV